MKFDGKTLQEVEEMMRKMSKEERENLSISDKTIAVSLRAKQNLKNLETFLDIYGDCEISEKVKEFLTEKTRGIVINLKLQDLLEHLAEVMKHEIVEAILKGK